MIEALATGRWLTDRRVTVVSALTLAMTVIAMILLFATGHGTLDTLGRPLGTDFSNVWSAGAMANAGRAALAWDWPAQHAVQQALHRDPAVPFYGWHYPPPFLLVASLLALLPYVWSLLLWQATTLALAAALVRRIVQHPRTLIATFGAPVVFVCLGHGHNGFLTAALLGGGLLLLDGRPFVAGLLIGCLVYKPQFALLLPLVLLVSGRWPAIAGAALSAGLLITATMLLWGWPVWTAFAESLPLTRTVIVEQGSTGWEKIQTLFSAVRSWGGGVSVAYAAQGALTATALAGSLLATRLAAPAVRNATVLAAALLSTPYALDYDFTILGLAIAFLVADGFRRGFLRWEISVLAFAWAEPLFARAVAAATLLPVGLIAAVALFVIALRRAVVLDAPGLSRRPRSSFALPRSASCTGASLRRALGRDRPAAG